MEIGNVKDASSEVSVPILKWPEWILIGNKYDIEWGRPNLWSEVINPKNLMSLDPLERYVCYLYYTCAISNRDIGLKLGYNNRVVERIHDIINELAWSQATPLMLRLRS